MSISNFSISQNPKITFLKSLNQNIDKYMLENLKKMDPNSKNYKEQQIELMYNVEKKRIEEIMKYCSEEQKKNQFQENSTIKSTLTKSSNFSTTVLNEKKKFLKTFKNKDLKKLKKQSVFVNSKKDNLLNLISKKRNSSQLSNFSNFTEDRYNKDKKLFNKQILKSIYKNKFKLENLKEEKESESSSEITYEDCDSISNCSIISEEMLPEVKMDFKNFKEDFFRKKEVFVLSLVKLKNKIVFFKEENKNLNFLSFFKDKQHQRVLSFDNEDYNYSFYLDCEKFLENKIGHFGEVNFLEETENRMEIENEEKDEISIIIQDENENTKNEDFSTAKKFLPNFYSLQVEDSSKKYSVTLNGKYFEIKNFENLNRKIDERNILKCSFSKKKNFFKASLKGGFYGSFVNLDKKKFQDRLILENGMLFMVNNKRGFYISNISGKDEFEKKELIFKKNFRNIEFCPTNFKYEKKDEFYNFLLDYFGEINDGMFDKAKFKKFFNLFCFENLKTNKISFICLDFVEFFKNYKLYRTKLKCIIFQINSVVAQKFFKLPSENYEFSFGNDKYNLMKNLDLNCLNTVFSFNTPYNLKIGFLSTMEKYYFEYKKEKKEINNSYCNFFSTNKEDCIKFKDISGNYEGIWICLSKFNIFQNEFVSENEILLPFDCYIMNYQNVFKISKDLLKI